MLRMELENRRGLYRAGSENGGSRARSIGGARTGKRRVTLDGGVALVTGGTLVVTSHAIIRSDGGSERHYRGRRGRPRGQRCRQTAEGGMGGG